MANQQNLKPFTSEQSHEEAVQNGKKGGIASGVSKRNKKMLKECLEELLEKEIVDTNGELNTGAGAMAVAVFKKALEGDLKAFEVVRDTAGQKPAEKVVVSNIDPDVIAQVERMVNE